MSSWPLVSVPQFADAPTAHAADSPPLAAGAKTDVIYGSGSKAPGSIDFFEIRNYATATPTVSVIGKLKVHISDIAVSNTGIIYCVVNAAPSSILTIDPKTGTLGEPVVSGYANDQNSLTWAPENLLYSAGWQDGDIRRTDLKPCKTSVHTTLPTSAGDMARDPTTGLLYVCTLTKQLYQINPADGKLTLLGELDLGSQTASIPVDRKGQLYATTSGDNSDLFRFYSVDKKTGQATLIADFTKLGIGTRGMGASPVANRIERPDLRSKDPSPAKASRVPAAGPAGKSAIQSYVIFWDFDATKAKPTANGEILIPVPSDEPYQRARWELSGVATQRIVNAEGGKLVAVRPRGANFRLRVTVEPTATEIAKPNGKVPAPAEALACLRDNTAFATRNSETAKLARELKADDPVQTVQNIRHWIKKNMTYRFDPELKQKENAPVGGIDAILQAEHGDCGGHAYLFVSLCRQAGVPARVLWGPVKILEPGSVPKETGLPGLDRLEPGDFCGHAWAEVFVTGWGWIPLEPQAFAHEVPLGRVPPFYVPFVRLELSGAQTTDAMLAIGNVASMNYFPKLEKPQERGDSTDKAQPLESKQSPPKKK